jgi:hypothetical protein
MSGIASVGSHKFITRMFAAMASLQMFAPINTIALTGTFALVGVSSAAAEPVYYSQRNRGGAVGYSRGISGLSIGMGGGFSIGPSRSMNIEPSSGARPSRVSSGPSGSARAIRNTSGSQSSSGKFKITDQQFKQRAVIRPKSTTIGSNSTSNPAPANLNRPSVSGPKQGSILAGPTNASAPNGEAGRNTGSQGGFDRQGPVLQGGGPGNQGGRDSAVFRDGGGATSSRQGTGGVRDNSTASRDAKSVSRDKASGSQDSKAASRDNATAPADGKAASRDNATASSDGTGASLDGAVGSRDGAGGGTLKADDIRRAMDRCAQTYVSYDRATMIYLDHNGEKQSCP